jgi:hypothetical protein
MSTRFRVSVAALAVLVAGAVAIAAYRPGEAADTIASVAKCPAGYQSKAALERSERAAGIREVEGARKPRRLGDYCINNKHPEKTIEFILGQEARESVRSAPYDHAHPSAYSNALAERADRVKNVKIKGTDGTWQPYGSGPLIVNDANYGQVNGLGLVYNAGRLDSLKYDAVNKRLFAAKGTGGVWMSTDGGASWRSIGDTLPSQVVGAVAWSQANGGTVLAVSGDPSYGSGGYTGYGAFYSNDLGTTWSKAAGIPDGALGFTIEVDPTNPLKVYAGTSFGLYRSVDGGKTYSNVNLPTGECAGVPGSTTGRPECLLANVVTDVEIARPGGVNTTSRPGTILAAVGWRAGPRANSDGTIQSPNNGLYRSDTGDVGSFVKVNPLPGTFTQPVRIGRLELGATVGPQQDHDYMYAIVQDAAALNGELDILDVPVPDPKNNVGNGGTLLNGIYVSADFGLTWLQMADDNAIAKDPASGSALVGAQSGTGYEPGVQAWYNEWIQPDPTQQTADGVPTRLAFGLEEVWQNDVTGAPLNGPATFKVIGRYYADRTCAGLIFGTAPPACPNSRDLVNSKTTTHPDQQDGIWIPDGNGGVTLAVGNDGGFYRNHVAAGQELSNDGWGDGDQAGFNTLLPYDAQMANDGTVYAGLQDNGELKIDPSTRKQYEVIGGDGGETAVDPADSSVAYEEYVFGAMKVTTDGGKTWRAIAPTLTGARFINPFEMDPANSRHLVTGANEIMETIYGPETNGPDAAGMCTLNCWKKVYDLGTRLHPGDPSAAPPTTDPGSDPNLVTSTIDVYGDAAYVGYCGVCDILNAKVQFKSGLATNVGGSDTPERMTSNGWHIASAKGLPNRFITSVTIDPRNIHTVYVTLGGYSRRWVPPGSLQDDNDNLGVGHVFKSTDSGENFTDISGNLPDVPATSLVLRGSQLIVGTDVGAFANDPKGGTTFAPLKGLPVVPISNVTLKPNDPDLLVAATYGRGVWTFRFAEPLRNPPIASGGTCTNATGTPPAPAGTTLAGPFGFEADEAGWTAGSTNIALANWRRLGPGNNSTYAFAAAPYNGPGYPSGSSTTAVLVSPRIDNPGGWVFVDFAGRYDTEPGFDYVFVDWSCDGGAWSTVPYVWDSAAGAWSTSFQFTGQNPDFPLFTTEKVAFQAPAGPLYLRFRLFADQLAGSPAYQGAWVDDIVVKR